MLLGRVVRVWCANSCDAISTLHLTSRINDDNGQSIMSSAIHSSFRLSRRLLPHHRWIRSKTISRSFATPSNPSWNHAVDHESLSIDTSNCNPSTTLSDSTTLELLASSPHTPVTEIAWWDVSVYATDVVHWVHDITGFPYAASIAAVTVLGRVCLVPIAVWHLRNNPWEPHLLELKTLYDKSKDPRARARFKAEIERLQHQFPRRNRLALPAASLGTTLFLWVGLRRMGTLYPSELAVGGLAWFPDLTQADPTLFLPILSNFLLYTVHELGADETGRPRQQLQGIPKYAWRGLTSAMFCVWFFLPSSILCFWIPHSALSCVQTVVFSQPAVRDRLGFGRGRGRPRPSGSSSATKKKDPEITYYREMTAISTTIESESEETNAKFNAPVRMKKTRKKSARRKKM
jgi:membrane protein insertase Oxa1/YidC/SpoIIIJ